MNKYQQEVIAHRVRELKNTIQQQENHKSRLIDEVDRTTESIKVMQETIETISKGVDPKLLEEDAFDEF